MLAMQIIFFFLQLGLVIFLFYMCLAFLTGAPFVPSKNPTAEAMVALANIKKSMKVYDLGSGNGKLLLLAKKKGAVVTGYEINPWLVIFSNLRGAKTVWKNFWKADLTDADVVFVYLLPYRMEKLENKLKHELKKGALVVSNSFIFPNWEVYKQDNKNHVYVYKV